MAVYDFDVGGKSVSRKTNVLVSSVVPGSLKVDGKKYTLGPMLYLALDIKAQRASYRKRGVSYRSIKYRHPKDNVVARIFYVR